MSTAPALELTPQAMVNLVAQLREEHAIYSPCFQRREPREGAQQYLHGLWLELPRTAIEPMVLAVEGAQAKAVRTRPVFLSEGAWDDAAILKRHGQAVDQDLGETAGVLTWDGRDWLKQGQEAVGVKRQDGGEGGKRANCHAGVCLGYASHQGETLWERRLDVPPAWVADAA
jgi:SRSO17 transposase